MCKGYSCQICRLFNERMEALLPEEALEEDFKGRSED